MRDLGSFRDFSFRLEYQGQEFGNFAINRIGGYHERKTYQPSSRRFFLFGRLRRARAASGWVRLRSNWHSPWILDSGGKDGPGTARLGESGRVSVLPGRVSAGGYHRRCCHRGDGRGGACWEGFPCNRCCARWPRGRSARFNEYRRVLQYAADDARTYHAEDR